MTQCLEVGRVKHESVPKPVQALLLRHAQSAPERLAVKAHDGEWTYGQLADVTARAAAGMSARGVEAGDRVVIAVPNSAAFVATALASMWIGAVFVPVFADEAPDRIGSILADCDPALVVSEPERAASFDRLAMNATTLEGLLAAGSGGEPPVASGNGGNQVDIYMIYTSGTSGSPKGVQIGTRAFLSAISATAEGIGISRSTRSLCVSPFHFDGSYATLFPTLLCGGAVIIPRRSDLLFLKRFFRSVHEDRVTHTAFSPSYLSLLLKSRQLAGLSASVLQSVGLGGEELIAGDLLRLWEAMPDLRVYNYYGPTETTIETTTYELSKDSLRFGHVPLGRPHRGVTFHLISDTGQPIDRPGQVGELCISGEQLMSGYWRDEALTARLLRDDLVAGLMVYRTGDLARVDTEGIFYFMGRNDALVKRGGVRISLIEVNRSLLKVAGVTSSVCLPVGPEGRISIVAFVETDGSVGEDQVLAELDRFLPRNMHPDRVRIVPSLPMTSRGKLDRAALLAFHGS